MYDEFSEETAVTEDVSEDIKEEPLKVPKTNFMKEFLLDPASGNFSMSRLCMGIVVLVFMPVYFVLYAYGVEVPPAIIVSSLASLATVYGLNSFAGSMYGRSRYRGSFGGYGGGYDSYGMGRYTGMDLTQPSSRTGKVVKVGTREVEEIER